MRKKNWMPSLTAWLFRGTSPRPSRRRAGKAAGLRLTLEPLEDRRLLSAGALDTTFNVTGKNTVGFNLGGSNDDDAHGSTLQSDGKFVLVGAAAGAINGSVQFTPRTTAAVGLLPNALASGDFNGDGRLDLAVANYASNSVSVLLGTGFGGFLPQSTLAVGTHPEAVVAGDFNGDGKLDLVTANYGNGTLSFLAGNGNGTFAAAVPINLSGKIPDALAVGDVNGDSKLDLVTGNTDGTVSVLTGNGNGTFTQTDFTVGARPFAVGLADVSGDNKLDIVTANRLNDSVSVLVNNGNGTFGAATAFSLPAGSQPTALALGDLNHDTKIDIVTANLGTNSVGVLLGNGNGTFGTASILPVGSQPRSVAITDINGNGNPDIVSANTGDNTVSILLGNGDGTFQSQQTVATGSAPNAVIAGNYTSGNTVADLVVSNAAGASVTLLANNSAVGLSDFAVARFNTNGTLDTTFGNNGKVTIGFNLGGQNEDRAYSVVQQPLDGKLVVGGFAQVSATDYDFAAVRLNPDGSLDTSFGTNGLFTVKIGAGTNNNDQADGIVVQPFDGKIVVSGFSKVTAKDSNFVVLRLNTNGTLDTSFNSSGAIPGVNSFGFNYNPGGQNDDEATAVALDFLNGTNGIVVGGFAQTSNVTTSTFSVSSAPVGSLPQAVTTGDFNNDGKADIAVANNGSGTVSILLGNGNGTFASQVMFAVGTNPTGIVAADFNSDGNTDLAVTNAGGSVSVLLGNGNGTFQLQQTTATTATPAQPVVGDFNGDGKRDLAFVTGGNVGILLGNGNGTFQTEQTVSAGITANALVAGDFNNDGKTDLAVAATGTSQGTLLLGNGNGTFAAQAPFALGAGPTALAARNLNRDANLDLIALSNNGEVSTLLGNGNGTFQAQQTFAGGGSGGTALAVGDFNNDGALDVAVPNSAATNPGTVTILLGANDGTLFGPQTYAVGSGPVALAVGDFNGDQAPDIVSANQGADSVSILTNVPAQGGYVFAVARLKTDGTLDPLFGVGGKSFASFADKGFANAQANSISVQQDGRILLTGFAQVSPNSYDFAAARFRQLGLPDGSFGGTVSGTAVYNILNGGFSSEDVALTAQVQPGGDILVGGYAQTPTTGLDFAAARVQEWSWIPIRGDWTGKGFDSVGMYDPYSSTFYLSNSNATPASGAADITIQFGAAAQGWLPVVGDWTGSLGVDAIGLYDPFNARFYLRDGANTPGVAPIVGGTSGITFGPKDIGWLPVVGRWKPTQAADTVALFDQVGSNFYINFTNTSKPVADFVLNYGQSNGGWLPLAGDWTGKGYDSIGAYQPSIGVFFLRNSNTPGGAEIPDQNGFAYGAANTNLGPVMGEWVAGATADTVGVYEPKTGFFFLRNSNSTGPADNVFRWGPADLGGEMQLASGTASGGVDLTAAQLNFIVGNALLRFQSAGLSQDQLNAVLGTNFVITNNLPAGALGMTVGSTVYLSANAAGYGWFVDPTPGDNEEFASAGPGLPLAAIPGGPASGKMDLLSVVLHELGHEAGLNDLAPGADPGSLMALTLEPGVRRLDIVDALFAAQSGG